MRPLTLSLALCALACQGKDDATDTDTDTTSDTDGDTDVAGDDGLVLDEVITISEPTPSDLTCFTAGQWLSQTADASCVAKVPVTGDVEDFESGDGIPGLDIEVWYDDALTATPDTTLVSGEGGALDGGEGWTCQAWSARVSSSTGDYLTTIHQHWSEPFSDPMDTFLNVVSSSTLALMTTLIGVTPDLDKGVIAGTSYHCGGEGQPMEGVQVIARDVATGKYPSSQEIRYFEDEFPSRNQPQTSEDGLWLIANVPPGDYEVEMYAVLEAGGEPTLIGKTGATVEASAVTVADAYTGSEDGAVIPSSCESPCGSPPVQ